MDFKNLISQGYTALDILNSLISKEPKRLQSVKKLLQYGYSASTILQHLSGDKKSKPEEYMTAEEKTKRNTQKTKTERATQFGGTLAGLGALGLGAAGLIGKGAQVAIPAATEAISSQVSQNPLSKEAIIDQASKLSSPQGLESFPEINRFVESMLKSGKSSEEIYEKIYKSNLMSPIIRKFESQSGKSFLDIIEDAEEKFKTSSVKGKPPILSKTKKETTGNKKVNLLLAIKNLRDLMENSGQNG